MIQNIKYGNITIIVPGNNNQQWIANSVICENFSTKRIKESMILKLIKMDMNLITLHKVGNISYFSKISSKCSVWS